mmetsp:Transcript_28136/g.83845  ORF Transcript_28136/g.83845 Transcript_28136/m.83845 type:complete len:240 (+) Transcript_28136:1020-1739(+)
MAVRTSIGLSNRTPGTPKSSCQPARCRSDGDGQQQRGRSRCWNCSPWLTRLLGPSDVPSSWGCVVRPPRGRQGSTPALRRPTPTYRVARLHCCQAECRPHCSLVSFAICTLAHSLFAARTAWTLSEAKTTTSVPLIVLVGGGIGSVPQTGARISHHGRGPKAPWHQEEHSSQPCWTLSVRRMLLHASSGRSSSSRSVELISLAPATKKGGSFGFHPSSPSPSPSAATRSEPQWASKQKR